MAVQFREGEIRVLLRLFLSLGNVLVVDQLDFVVRFGLLLFGLERPFGNIAVVASFGEFRLVG